MRQLISAVCILCFPALCLGEPVPFDWAHKTGDGPDTKLSWGDESDGFSLSSDGTLSPKSNSLNPELNLPINKGAWIEQLQVTRHDKDLILAYQTDNGEDGRGFICRISWPVNIIRWCQDIPGFNIRTSSGVDSIYIGAIGFMGRLDPKNGNYIWRHDGLYEKDHALNIVCLSKENETTVTFNASSRARNSEIEEISLDRNSGKMLQASNIGVGEVCR